MHTYRKFLYSGSNPARFYYEIGYWLDQQWMKLETVEGDSAEADARARVNYLNGGSGYP